MQGGAEMQVDPFLRQLLVLGAHGDAGDVQRRGLALDGAGDHQIGIAGFGIFAADAAELDGDVANAGSSNIW